MASLVTTCGPAATAPRVACWATALAVAVCAAPGCATVAPQERALLADPTMQFQAESKHESSLRHALDNREGSTGGAGVAGGGCGCN